MSAEAWFMITENGYSLNTCLKEEADRIKYSAAIKYSKLRLDRYIFHPI